MPAPPGLIAAHQYTSGGYNPALERLPAKVQEQMRAGVAGMAAYGGVQTDPTKLSLADPKVLQAAQAGNARSDAERSTWGGFTSMLPAAALAIAAPYALQYFAGAGGAAGASGTAGAGAGVGAAGTTGAGAAGAAGAGAGAGALGIDAAGGITLASAPGATALGSVAGAGASAGAGSVLASLGGLGGALNLGSSLYGLYLAHEQMGMAEDALKASDPFGPYRAEYAQRLRDLDADPTSITKTPGYEFQRNQGEEGLVRQMAALGFLGSGNLGTALVKYNQDYAATALGAERNRLAGLAGAGISPNAGPALSGYNMGIDTASSALASLGYQLGNKDNWDWVRRTFGIGGLNNG